MSNIPDDQYILACGTESFGGSGILGIKILIAHNAFTYDSRNKAHAKLYNALQDAKEAIDQEMTALAYAANPNSAIHAEQQREQLVGSFPAGSVVYVEEIPNGYCSLACCRHLPWFKVTTSFGVVTLGWRKRVVNIDWSESRLQHGAEALFPGENTTKGDRYIHAWSVDRVKGYLATLYNNASRSKPDPYVAPPKPEAVEA